MLEPKAVLPLHPYIKRRQLLCQSITPLIMHAGVLKMIDDVRRFSRALRPIYLEEAGLASGLERLALESNELAKKQQRSCEVAFALSGNIPRLPPDVEMTLFRIAQEGITNALKHAARDAMAGPAFRRSR